MDNQQIINLTTGIIRRRKTGFILISLPVFAAAVAVALLLPPIYQSKTTILIESQQIPDEYVKTAVDTYVEERLEIIKQQVLSRPNLQEIITQHNLYPEMRKQQTWEEVIARMRNDISVKTISASNRRTRRGSITIAFSLSYEGQNPSTVQKIANVLASLYLEENVKSREQRAVTTTQYLQDELDNVKQEIDVLDKKIADLKTAHFGELPEFNAVNLRTIEQLRRDRDQIDTQIKSLEERKIYLQGQLTILKSQRIVDVEGNTVVNPREHLEALKLKLSIMQADLSDKHPDVISLKNEIKQFEAQIQAEQAKSDQESDSASRPSIQTHPAYMSIEMQIEAADREILNLIEEKAQLKSKIIMYERRIERAPQVETEYNNLRRDHQHATSRYNEIMGRLSEAKAAQALEETQRSERFTILEPAQLPVAPYKPDRKTIVLVGFVMAIGAGAGFAGLRESMDSSIKTVEELTAITGLPLLSTLPKVKTDEERHAGRLKIIILITAGLVMAACALLAIHLYFMPLDILWIKIQKRLMW